jgi:hypothetical protein
MYNILFSSHFLNRIFYKIAAQGLVVSVTFCYRTEEVRSAVKFYTLQYLYFLLYIKLLLCLMHIFIIMLTYIL